MPPISAIEDPLAFSNERCSVLLVEGDLVVQLLVRSLIERCGWTITTADDGRSALELLGRERFDLVLVAIEMTGPDGYETIRGLRNLEKSDPGGLGRTPAVGLTSQPLWEGRQLRLDAGIDDCLALPLEPDALCDAVRRNARGALEEGRAPPAELSAALRDNPALLRRLTEMFVQDCPAKLAELRDAVKRGAAPEIERAAHGLRGTLVVFGAHRSADSAGRLEASARHGQLEDAPALYENLERDVQRLAFFLSELSELPTPTF